MIKKKIAVIGAGPAGITAGYELAKAGHQVLVFETSDQVGGMARSIKLWDQIVDIGPHRFFSSDTRVNELWLELAGKDYEMVDRLTRIYYNRKFYDYPIKAINALKNLGIWEAGLCVLSYIGAVMNRKPIENTFEGWVTDKFGRRLFIHFFKTYSEKLWGISCKELDADFAAQRIKKLSLWEAIKNAVLGGGSKKHKTLVDQFAYPLEGTGMIYNRMQTFIESHGGNVLLKNAVEKIIVKSGKACGLKLVNGDTHEFDYILSSMPLSLAVMKLDEAPNEIVEKAKMLRFRNTIIVYLNVAAKNLFPDNWLYIHSKELEFGRLTNFRNWLPSINGNSPNTILALEYWCYDNDELWKMKDEELIDLAKKEVRLTGLVGKSEILNGSVYHIPRCYPVYSTGYKEILLPIENYLKTLNNIDFIGRYGAFKYNNQDHSILMGILGAENAIAGEKRHNLWDINTDYENYQESSVITKIGLVKKGV